MNHKEVYEAMLEANEEGLSDLWCGLIFGEKANFKDAIEVLKIARENQKESDYMADGPDIVIKGFLDNSTATILWGVVDQLIRFQEPSWEDEFPLEGINGWLNSPYRREQG